MTIQALNRLSYYHDYLLRLKEDGRVLTTATAIADELKINEVVVRKDLSLIRTGKGRPNTGFEVIEMLSRIEDCLGYNNTTEAIIVGSGAFALSVLSSLSLHKTGMNIVAGFDPELNEHSCTVCDTDFFPVSKLCDLCSRLHIKAAVLAVPERKAQQMCEKLVESGIKYIMNYARVFLEVPQGVFVQNENPATATQAFLQYIRTEEQNKNNVACGQI